MPKKNPKKKKTLKRNDMVRVVEVPKGYEKKLRIGSVGWIIPLKSGKFKLIVRWGNNSFEPIVTRDQIAFSSRPAKQE